jgi:hypothetical protein
LLWWKRQPYIIDDGITNTLSGSLSRIMDVLPVEMVMAYLTLILLSLPMYALPLSPYSKTTIPKKIISAFLISLALLGILALERTNIIVAATSWDRIKSGWFFLGNVMYSEGLYKGTAIGEIPFALSPAIRWSLCIVVMFQAGFTISHLLNRKCRQAIKDTLTLVIEDSDRLRTVRALGWISIGTYLLLAFARPILTPGTPIFDRYLLPVLPIVFLSLMRRAQESGARRPGFFAWALLVVYGLYGIAGTHDYFSLLKVKLAAADSLRASGVPRTKIMAGLEYDGWTELQTTGHIRHPGIRNPATVTIQTAIPQSVPENYRWVSAMLPSVVPDYYIVESRQPGLHDIAEAGARKYRTWLPPYDREVFVQSAPSSTSHKSEQR